MAGLSLIDSPTLTVLAQQNAAPTNVNFNTQQNHGGSVFAHFFIADISLHPHPADWPLPFA